MAQLIGILLLICLIIFLYVMWVYLLFSIAWYVFPVACVVFIGAVLFNYVKVVYEELFIGKGWTDSPAGSEPAYKQYYFRKAYPDYLLVVEKSYLTNWAMVQVVFKKGFWFFQSGYVALALWPLGITYYLVVGAGIVAGVLSYVVFGLLHLSIVLTCAMLVWTTAFLLWSIESLQRYWRKINIRCPHAGCHKPIDLPHYKCPACGKAKHKNLVPGSYGVHHRQCECGAWLPTLFLFGRNQLPSFCPHPECGLPLDSGSQITRNLLIPIVGAVDSGKSSYLIASMYELHQLPSKGRASIAFPERKYETLYKTNERNFLTGVTAKKTVAESPDAFLLNINTGGDDRMLYMYDAAGELFHRTDSLRRQVYYDDADGVVFLIDPFSLSQLQTTLADDLKGAQPQIRPSSERPQDTYDKLMQAVEQETGAGKNFGKKPLAVVVTKTDALGIDAQIEGIIASQPPSENGSNHSESNAVRAWLNNNGGGNLIRAMEKKFGDVAYFYCSPLGRLPDTSNNPFTPKRVLDPLTWLLKDYGVDLKNGISAKSIAKVKTASAATYKPRVSAGGETVNGPMIAVLWGLSVLVLVITSLFLFAIALGAK
jgi:hypothetical protein